MKPIPQEWLKKYIEDLLGFAGKFGPESKMGQATLLRAEHIMDMVNSFKEHSKTI